MAGRKKRRQDKRRASEHEELLGELLEATEPSRAVEEWASNDPAVAKAGGVVSFAAALRSGALVEVTDWPGGTARCGECGAHLREPYRCPAALCVRWGVPRLLSAGDHVGFCGCGAVTIRWELSL